MTNYELFYTVGVLLAIIIPSISIYKEDKTIEFQYILCILGLSVLSWIIVAFYASLILQEDK